MSEMAVVIQANRPTPDPAVPEGLTEPAEIGVRNFEGADWTWTGKNVWLVRSYGSKTVGDELDTIVAGYENKMWRPVNASEMIQLEAHAAQWPDHWKDQGAGGRIFFPGSVYTLGYKTTRNYEAVWYAYFDSDTQEWQFGCSCVESLLRSKDGFACVAYTPGDAIPDKCCSPALPPPRRDRSRGVPREVLAMTR